MAEPSYWPLRPKFDANGRSVTETEEPDHQRLIADTAHVGV